MATSSSPTSSHLYHNKKRQRHEISNATTSGISQRASADNLYRDEQITLDDMLALVNQEESSDIKFIVGAEKKVIHAHSVILKLRSEYFRTMLSIGMRESHEKVMEKPNMEPSIFIKVLEYIYSGSVVLTNDDIFQVLAAADELGLDGLKTLCHRHVARNINADTVFRFMEAAMRIYSDPILNVCFEFVRRNTNLVLESRSFLSISKDCLMQLLDSYWLDAKELNIYKAVKRWGRHRIRQRKRAAAAAAAAASAAQAQQQQQQQESTDADVDFNHNYYHNNNNNTTTSTFTTSTTNNTIICKSEEDLYDEEEDHYHQKRRTLVVARTSRTNNNNNNIIIDLCDADYDDHDDDECTLMARANKVHSNDEDLITIGSSCDGEGDRDDGLGDLDEDFVEQLRVELSDLMPMIRFPQMTGEELRTEVQEDGLVRQELLNEAYQHLAAAEYSYHTPEYNPRIHPRNIQRRFRWKVTGVSKIGTAPPPRPSPPIGLNDTTTTTPTTALASSSSSSSTATTATTTTIATTGVVGGFQYSEPFEAIGTWWKLLFYPKGNHSKNSVSLYLAIDDNESLYDPNNPNNNNNNTNNNSNNNGDDGRRFEPRLAFNIGVINPLTKAQYVLQTAESHIFTREFPDWGFRDFIPIDEFHAKYVHNDTVIVEINITAPLSEQDRTNTLLLLLNNNNNNNNNTNLRNNNLQQHGGGSGRLRKSLHSRH